MSECPAPAHLSPAHAKGTSGLCTTSTPPTSPPHLYTPKGQDAHRIGKTLLKHSSGDCVRKVCESSSQVGGNVLEGQADVLEGQARKGDVLEGQNPQAGWEGTS